jgi:tyrosinase
MQLLIMTRLHSFYSIDTTFIPTNRNCATSVAIQVTAPPLSPHAPSNTKLGTIPYWEWGLDCGNVDKSPVFDGSETSMGGNGEKVSGGSSAASMFGAKPGTGGGCVKKGPFSNYTVNFGPITAANPLKYNPRCLKRDLNADICSRWASMRNTTQAILDSPNVELFQAIVQGDPRYAKSAALGLAVHGGGHYTIGRHRDLFNPRE